MAAFIILPVDFWLTSDKRNLEQVYTQKLFFRLWGNIKKKVMQKNLTFARNFHVARNFRPSRYVTFCQENTKTFEVPFQALFSNVVGATKELNFFQSLFQQTGPAQFSASL